MSSSFIGNYQLLRQIGRGGMAEVFLARSIRRGHMVALKITRSELTASPSAQQRLLDEAALMSRIHHRSVPRLLDSGLTLDGRAYLAIEWIQGSTLAEELRRCPLLPLTEAITIARQLAEALAAVSNAHIIHRDIKPENIIVTRHGGALEVKLIDFGIARSLRPTERERRLTTPGTVLGTPEYIAPEQLSDSAIDTRADLYALGVVMYRLFAGQLPFEVSRHTDHVDEVLAQRCASIPAPIAPRADLGGLLARRLNALVLKCLSTDPTQRPSSARSIAEALIPWEHPSESQRPRDWGGWFLLRSIYAVTDGA